MWDRATGRKCPEHGKFCAYWGDEPDRCPWCHCRWDHIVAAVARDPEHGHSCESPTVMTHHPERVREAASMRLEASSVSLRALVGTGVTPGAGRPAPGRQETR